MLYIRVNCLPHLEQEVFGLAFELVVLGEWEVDDEVDAVDVDGVLLKESAIEVALKGAGVLAVTVSDSGGALREAGVVLRVIFVVLFIRAVLLSVDGGTFLLNERENNELNFLMSLLFIPFY